MKHEVPFTVWLADATIRRIFLYERLERALLRFYECTRWRVLLKLFPAHYHYPLGTLRRCQRNGVHFEVDIGTCGGWLLYFHRSMKSRYADYVHPRETVMDVGGNQGEVALYFAQAVNNGGVVHSFEPNPAMFERLLRNIQLNPGLPCHAEPFALGASRGSMAMRLLDEKNPSTASIQSTQIPFGGWLGEVPITTLDDFVHERGISRIDFLKIDVEGFELEVCRGGEECIRRWHPRIFLELIDHHQRMYDSSARLVVEWLEGKGYSIHDAQTGMAVTSTSPLDNCHMDILCVHSAGGGNPVTGRS